MAKNAKILCPLMGGECIEDGALKDGELVACRFWVTVQGKHPQTGEEINSGDCAIAWQPVLMIENSKVNRGTQAAVESLRNESITSATQVKTALMHVASVQRLGVNNEINCN